jgi:hypothetical protein
MIKLARSLVLPLAVVLVSGTALIGCDKGKKDGATGGGGPTGAAGAAAIAPSKGGLKGALAAMPKETEMVIGLDFAQLRKSAVFKKYEPMIMEKIGKELEEFKSKCGFDPKEKLTGVLAGTDLPVGGGDPRNVTVFVRGFEKGPSLDCLKKVAAEQAAEGKTAVIDGDYVELSENGEVKLRAMFVDDSTVLFVKRGDGFADKATLVAAANAKEGEGLTSSAAFVKLLDEVKTGSSVFMVLNGNAAALSQNPLPFKIKAVFGWVNVGGEVAGETRVRMEDAEAASAKVGFYKMGVQEAKKSPAGKFIDSVKVSAKGPDVVASFKFSQAQIDEMVEMAKSF